MNKFLVSALLILLGASSVFAMDYSAASCEEPAIRAGLALAASGDTVFVPAGTCTWETKITVNPGIRLIGAGVGFTNITDMTPLGDAALELIAENGKFGRISGFTFDNNSRDKRPTNAFLEVSSISAENVVNGFRIDNFSMPNVKRRGILVQTSRDTVSWGYGLWGVIDHYSFTGVAVSGTTFRYQYVTIIGGPPYTNGKSAAQDLAANRPWNNTCDTGSSHNVFIENGTMSSTAFGDGAVEGYGGAAYVFRFTDIQNSTQGHHGSDSGAYRGTRCYAVYGIDFSTAGVTSQRPFLFRSGSGYIFENDFDAGYSAAKLHYDLYRIGHSVAAPWYQCNTGTRYPHPWDGNTSPNGYPCLDQTGWYFTTSLDGTRTLSPSYSWNNKRLDIQADFQAHIPAKEGLYIASNREYFNYNAACVGAGACADGIGTGLTAAGLPSTCTTGRGFVFTDGGSWNNGAEGQYSNYTGDATFYKCTAQDTWTLWMTPYPFPHPLSIDQ